MRVVNLTCNSGVYTSLSGASADGAAPSNSGTVVVDAMLAYVLYLYAHVLLYATIVTWVFVFKGAAAAVACAEQCHTKK